MKLRNFFYLLLALPLFIVGCTDSPIDEPTAKEIKLELTSEATLTFGAEGGKGTIAYKLENAPEGAVPTASCDDEWVTNITVAEAVTFDVEANEGAARSTKVVVSYEDKYFEVAVDQPAKNEVNLTLSSEATLTFGAEGGKGTIAYKLENAPEGAVPTASCDDEWVTNITVAEAVTFDVEANEGAARSTKVVVSYEDKYFEVAVNQAAYEPEYLYDETLSYAERIDITSYGYPLNYFFIYFYSEDGSILLGSVIVGKEGENTLSAGTYTSANGGLMMESYEIFIGYGEYYTFEEGNGEVVVGGDVDGYTIDIKLTDVNGNKFHFTYEGAVSFMDPFAGLPTEPVNFTAEYMLGMYNGTEYSAAHNYYFILSDLGFDSEGYALAGGKYYQLDLYGVEGVVDAEGYIHIPAGTYTFDTNYTTAEGTINSYYSGYYEVDAAGTGYAAKAGFEDGQLVVTDDGLTLTVTIAGVQHTVVYNQAPVIYIGGNGGDTPDIADDVEFTATYADVIYTPGSTDNYCIFLSDIGLDENGDVAAGGTYYKLDLYGVEPVVDGEGNYTVPAGKYTFDYYDSAAEWTMGFIYSTYVVIKEDFSGFEQYSLFDDGVVEVTENGINAELVIDGATHTVIFNGTPTFNNGATRSASLKQNKMLETKSLNIENSRIGVNAAKNSVAVAKGLKLR